MATVGEFLSAVGCIMIVYFAIPNLRKLAKKIVYNIAGDHKRQTYMMAKTSYDGPCSDAVTSKPPAQTDEIRSYEGCGLYPLPRTELNETSDILASETFPPPPPLLTARLVSSGPLSN